MINKNKCLAIIATVLQLFTFEVIFLAFKVFRFDDFVNEKLVRFLGELITTYVKQPIKHTRCGYACSDHANWTKNGYAAAIPAESAFEHTNPNIHSSRDTQDKLSLNHMTDYLKLATAFAVELAEPQA